MGYSTIQFKDYSNALMPVKIESSSMTQAKLETLGGVLLGYSNAVVTGVSVWFAKGTPGTPTNAEHGLVKDKALIVMRGADSRIVKVTIPAPKATLFTNVIKGVRIVDPTEGAAIAAAMSTATGKTLTYLNGRFVNKPGQAGL
jgi:hypothetical protein